MAQPMNIDDSHPVQQWDSDDLSLQEDMDKAFGRGKYARKQDASAHVAAEDQRAVDDQLQDLLQEDIRRSEERKAEKPKKTIIKDTSTVPYHHLKDIQLTEGNCDAGLYDVMFDERPRCGTNRVHLDRDP